MVLDHERLDVHHLALDFLVFANGVIEALPRGRSLAGSGNSAVPTPENLLPFESS
jgi:hypothetical protein